MCINAFPTLWLHAKERNDKILGVEHDHGIIDNVPYMDQKVIICAPVGDGVAEAKP